MIATRFADQKDCGKLRIRHTTKAELTLLVGPSPYEIGGLDLRCQVLHGDGCGGRPRTLANREWKLDLGTRS